MQQRCAHRLPAQQARHCRRPSARRVERARRPVRRRGEGLDAAFKAAIEDAKPRFRQCTRCGRWVCPQACWNESRGLCKSCAPDLAEEGAVLQARHDAQQLDQKMRSPEPAPAAAAGSAALAGTCPHCRASVDAGTKFCGECGKPLQVALACGKCGAKLPPSGRFCPECGEARP